MRHRIGAALQDLDVSAVDDRLSGGQPLDPGFQPVRHFPQAHRTRQTRATLERVQGAHARIGVRRRRRLARPVTQLRGELGQELERLLLEDRKQLEIDRIDRVDIVIDIAEGRRMGDVRRPVRFGRRGGERLQLREAERGEGCQGTEGRHARLGGLLSLDPLGGNVRRRLDRCSCFLGRGPGLELAPCRRGDFDRGFGRRRRFGHWLDRLRRRGDGRSLQVLVEWSGRGPLRLFGGARSARLAHVEAHERLDRTRGVSGRLGFDPAGELRRRGRRLQAQRRGQFVLGQAGQQLGIGLLQEAGGKLVQQAPDFLGGIDEQARFLVGAVADDLRAGEGMLERTRQVREVGEADGGRASGERVGECDRRLAERPVQLHRPFGDLGREAPRQLVGLVQVDVEQRNADPQRADHLDVLVARRLADRGRGGQGWRDGSRLGQRRRVGQRHRPRRRRPGGVGQRIAAGDIQQQVRRRLEGGVARLEQLDQRRSVGRDAEVEVDHAARHVERRVDDGRARAVLPVLLARFVEGVEHRRRSIVERRQIADGRCRLGAAIEAREIELEGHFGRRLGRFHGRRGACEFEVRGAGEAGGQAHRQGDVGAAIAARKTTRNAVGGELDLALVALAVAMRGDVLDPARQVAEHPGRELDQRRLGRSLLGKLGVEHLLARPGGIAERFEADHPAAALERVERTPYRRQQVEVAGRVLELPARRLRAFDHFARFLEEDPAHLVVVLEVAHERDRLHRRRKRHRLADHVETRGLGRGGDEVDQRFRQLAARRRHFRQVAGGGEDRLLRFQHRGGQHRLVRSLRFVRQTLELARDVLQGHVFAHRAEGEHLRLLDQPRFDRHRLELAVLRRVGTAHQRGEPAGLGVEHEQRLGELRLHAQHVDHEAERAQVAGDAVEHAGLGDRGGVDFGRDQAVDLVAHAQQRLRCLVHAQHRKHATHRCQLHRYVDEHAAVRRIAEEIVDRLFGDAERGAQLLDHAAHRLPVGDAPVELLHPGLERRRRRVLAHRGEALAEALHPVGVLGIVEVAVLERGLDVEQAGRDLHRHRRRRWRVRGLGLADRGLQLGGERFAVREQPAQRVADQGELLGQAGDAMHLAARRGRPGLLGGSDALLGVDDDRRIEAAEHAQRIVGRRLLRQAVRGPGGVQARQTQPRRGGSRLRAEKQQVAGEPLGDVGVAAAQDPELRQQARGDALGEDVEGQQAVVLRLEHRRGQVPEGAHLRMRGAGGEGGRQVAHLCRSGQRLRAAHQLQQMRLQLGAEVGVGGVRRDVRIVLDLAPAPVHRPEVGRVDALGLDRFLDRAVLREQRQRGDVLAGEDARQVVEQGERRPLDVGHELGRERLRPADAALHRVFAGAQHHRGGRQADQLERADALVDLRTGGAQHAGIDAVEVGAGDRLQVLDEAAQRLVRGVERAA
jgi:hypothetical protein